MAKTTNKGNTKTIKTKEKKVVRSKRVSAKKVSSIKGGGGAKAGACIESTAARKAEGAVEASNEGGSVNAGASEQAVKMISLINQRDMRQAGRRVKDALEELLEKGQTPKRLGTALYFVMLGKVLEQLILALKKKKLEPAQLARLSKIVCEQKRAEAGRSLSSRGTPNLANLERIPLEIGEIVKRTYPRKEVKPSS